MPLDAFQLVVDVIVERLSDFYMVSAQLNLHGMDSWLANLAWLGVGVVNPGRIRDG
jgi:hypothetical protein